MDGSRLTLMDARQALANMEGTDGIDALDIERAREFVQWCEDYWRKRGYGDDDSISIVLSC